MSKRPLPKAPFLAFLLVLSCLSGATAVRAAGPVLEDPGASGEPRPLSGALGSPPEEAARYAQCLSLARENPKEALDRAVAWDSEAQANIVSHHCLAVALIAVQNFSSAGEALERTVAAARKPAYAGEKEILFTLLHQTGQAWMLAEQNARAEKNFSEALGMAPEHTGVLVDRAIVRAEAGNYAGALEDLDKAITLNSDLREAYVLRAAALRMTGNLKAALADAEHALTLAPRDPDALFERGLIRQKMGNSEGARADWQDVILLSPGTPLALSARENMRRLPPKAAGEKADAKKKDAPAP